MTSKFDDLRHRPFLVIETLVKPSETARTERKGWYEQHAIPVEQPRIEQRISHRTLCTASVIIDLSRNQIIKDRNATMTPEDAVSYYSQKYADLIGPALDQWGVAAMMQQWEYLRRIDLSEKQLNELGGVGWELVAVAPIPPLHNEMVYLLKRKTFLAALLNIPSEIEGLFG